MKTFNKRMQPDPSTKNSGTSHVSIVDKWGNALSMTTTIESSFGNGVMVNGFLLNNELTDFSFAATDSSGEPIANRVQGNKRPRSSMSPTIVFDEDGRVEIVTGSPGGSRIIGYTAQSIVNMIDFGLDPQEAINVPHYMNRNYDRLPGSLPGSFFGLQLLDTAVKVTGFSLHAGERQVAVCRVAELAGLTDGKEQYLGVSEEISQITDAPELGCVSIDVKQDNTT